MAGTKIIVKETWTIDEGWITGLKCVTIVDFRGTKIKGRSMVTQNCEQSSKLLEDYSTNSPQDVFPLHGLQITL